MVSLLIELGPVSDRKVVIYITAKYLYVNELTYKNITKIRLKSNFFSKKYACSDIFFRKYDQNMHMELRGYMFHIDMFEIKKLSLCMI